ncbi:ABC transporter ATP-binding protein [Nakamurella lactea]|uniref:ABC transporter ATP-binding protein n=1 Tax=Nakamurella lactea TaxID=459515 RepID=UPI001B7F978E|nr:ABC transporter ATP-binding protein [Nakamurella lactea]
MSTDSNLDRPMGRAELRAESVTRVFRSRRSEVHALGPVSLTIGAGQFVSLVGPSGCGKSTLVKLIAGLLTPTEGEFTIATPDGRPPTIATVFQDFGIFPWKTVLDNVALALRAQGVDAPTARSRAVHWLERMGLESFQKAYPSTLSGGMKQRVAIARALATEPDVLLMDEPFASLDASLRQLLQEDLLTIAQQDVGRTVVFVTHSLEEAIFLSHRVIVMSSRPGTVLDDVEVPFPRDRDASIRESLEFNTLRGTLWEHLKGQVSRPQTTKGR